MPARPGRSTTARTGAIRDTKTGSGSAGLAEALYEELPGDAPVAVVLKRSAWRKWVEEERDARILALVEAGDETVRRMRPGHVAHTETVEEVRRALATLGIEATWHEHPHGFELPARRNRCRLVITVGGDGTLLGASHGIGPGVPLLGVNSSPDLSVGFFCFCGAPGRTVSGARSRRPSTERCPPR